MRLADRKEFFHRLQDINPQPVTELNYRNPFELLIAVMLSAQATDISVNKATKHLFKAAKSASEMLELGEIGVKKHIRTIGLFNTKAANVIKTCDILQQQYHGAVPRNREALEQLPGVGRKTANVVLNTAFGEPTIAVDTHIFRVSNRTGLAKGKTPLEVELKLLKSVPKEYRLNAHHWLILHGRYTCKARKPVCPECIVRDLCSFKSKTSEVD